MRGGGTVLVDTGPLVALFDPSDWHARCQVELARLGRDRLVTSLAVLTEATCLLGFARRAQRALLVFVAAAADAMPTRSTSASRSARRVDPTCARAEPAGKRTAATRAASAALVATRAAHIG